MAQQTKEISAATTRLREVVEELAASWKKNVENFFKLEVQKLFTEFPAIEEISWQQYTPYYCDGDPCVFRLGDILVNEREIYEFKYAIEDAEKKARKTPAELAKIQTKLDEAILAKQAAVENENYVKAATLKDVIENLKDSLKPADVTALLELQKAAIEASDRLKSFSKDMFLLLFGDHVTVTIDRKGIKTTRYDHE